MVQPQHLTPKTLLARLGSTRSLRGVVLNDQMLAAMPCPAQHRDFFAQLSPCVPNSEKHIPVHADTQAIHNHQATGAVDR